MSHIDRTTHTPILRLTSISRAGATGQSRQWHSAFQRQLQQINHLMRNRPTGIC
jgi:hypothetical protein